MSAFTPSPIVKALFQRLQDKVSLVGPTSFSRKAISPSNLPQLPCLELRLISVAVVQERGAPAKYRLGLDVILRARAASEALADSPEDPLFDLIQEVVAALSLQTDERGHDTAITTLGGLVERCWISGSIDFHDSTVSADLAAATIPVEILSLTRSNPQR